MQRLRLRPHVPLALQVRSDMVLLSDRGWSPPRIAAHLAYHPHTVRAVLRRFEDRGLDGLTPDAPGPAPDQPRRTQVEAALTTLLAQERTWTATQLAAALGEQGRTRSARQTRRYRHGLGARWRRTARTLHHQQHPERVRPARQTLGALKKGRQPAASPWPPSTSAAARPASR